MTILIVAPMVIRAVTGMIVIAMKGVTGINTWNVHATAAVAVSTAVVAAVTSIDGTFNQTPIRTATTTTTTTPLSSTSSSTSSSTPSPINILNNNNISLLQQQQPDQQHNTSIANINTDNDTVVASTAIKLQHSPQSKIMNAVVPAVACQPSATNRKIRRKTDCKVIIKSNQYNEI